MNNEEYEIIFVPNEGRAIKNNKTHRIYYSEFQIIEEKDKEIERLKEEIYQLNLDKNELMKTGFECCDKVRNKYKSRIDKAIEYIETLNKLERELGGTVRLDRVKLENILKGEDK